MKKAGSIALILFLCYNFFGYFLISKIEQLVITGQIREQILPWLPVNQLVLIKAVTGVRNDISWIEAGKEFVFQGTMYDVVKTKVEHDTTFYYCFNDKKESKLLANLDKMVRDQTDRSRSKSNSKKLVITFFYQSSNPYIFALTPFAGIVTPTPSFISIPEEVLSPPPEPFHT